MPTFDAPPEPPPVSTQTSTVGATHEAWTLPTFAAPPSAPNFDAPPPPTWTSLQAPVPTPASPVARRGFFRRHGKSIGIFCGGVFVGLVCLGAMIVVTVTILGNKVKATFTEISNTLPGFEPITNTLPTYDGAPPEASQAPNELAMTDTAQCIDVASANGAVTPVDCSAPHNAEFLTPLSSEVVTANGSADAACQSMVRGAVGAGLTPPASIVIQWSDGRGLQCYLTSGEIAIRAS
jgi:hypothetical protein